MSELRAVDLLGFSNCVGKKLVMVVDEDGTVYKSRNSVWHGWEHKMVKFKTLHEAAAHARIAKRHALQDGADESEIEIRWMPE